MLKIYEKLLIIGQLDDHVIIHVLQLPGRFCLLFYCVN